MALLDEGFTADIAAIRTLVAVNPNVVDQVDLLNEADAADQTLVRPFTGVDFCVVGKCRALNERLSAGETLEGSFPCLTKIKTGKTVDSIFSCRFAPQ